MDIPFPHRIPTELVTSGIIEFLTMLPSADSFKDIRTALGRAYGGVWIRAFCSALRDGRELIQALTLVLLQIVEATTGHRPTKENALLIRAILKRKQQPGT